ncbi:unnamed protein product [Cylicostephanus goldi]|uniref:Potassium channel tetramerisation-type BTB domain-containing protein n=1 Tax=Cylicostephanus goldi TaxID=71465 RepID=A0A3P6S1X4_CYLGO|nr:unnamed protein product [Cylicostephanus goldi]
MCDARFQWITDRDRNQRELFIDRNPVHFARILDYLQSRENFTPPWDDCARAELRREAEYFNLPELIKMCSENNLQKGDKVRWKENVVEAYWKFLLTYWFRWSDERLHAKCPDCNNTNLSDFLDLNGSKYFLRSLHIKHHMSLFRGTITSVTGAFCGVNWGQCSTFVPQSVLRKVEEVEE